MSAGRFVTYAAVGAVGTAVQYAVLIGLVHTGVASALAASCLGAVLGAAVNYLLNHRITFRSGRGHGSAGARFAGVAALALAANWAIMALLVWLGLNYLLAQVVTTAAVLALTYSANAAWSFRATPTAA